MILLSDTLLAINPEVELLDYMMILFCILCGTTVFLSTAVAPCYIPTNSAYKLQFLDVLTSTCHRLAFFFIVAIHNVCLVVSHFP